MLIVVMALDLLVGEHLQRHTHKNFKELIALDAFDFFGRLVMQPLTLHAHLKSDVIQCSAY